MNEDTIVPTTKFGDLSVRDLPAWYRKQIKESTYELTSLRPLQEYLRTPAGELGTKARKAAEKAKNAAVIITEDIKLPDPVDIQANVSRRCPGGTVT